jgi:hypothetical protein
MRVHTLPFNITAVILGVFFMSSFCSAQRLPPLAGITTRLSLISEVSSKSVPNSSFAARLDQPVQFNGKVLIPSGSVFQGHVQSVKARRLQRFGSVRLIFDTVRLPNGTIEKVDLSVTNVEGKLFTSNSEGTIHSRRSKKRLLLELGGGAAAAKLADDLSELASASVTKNTARFFGLGGIAAFLLLQKGSDVKLPPGTAVDVVFGRPGELLPK